MAQTTNIPGTSGGSITVVLPDSPRARREAKALAVVKKMRPAEVEPPPFVPYVPPKPDQTYTLWGLPNDTFLKVSSIYFMYSAGRIKIGFSAGLRSRHNGLKKAGPYPPVVLLVIPGTEKDERKLHARFKEDRLHGEWFALSPKIRSFLRTRLCDRGLASFERAEAEFRDCCAAFLEHYRPPPKRQPRQLCTHGLILHHPCKDCARDRDLAILENLKGSD